MYSDPSMAQLSSWTEAMGKKNAGAKADKKEPEPSYRSGTDMNYETRELRANSSIERMETWTESMKKNPNLKAKSPAKGGDDEYADEEFEDYDEDFEADESEEPAPAKAAPAPAPVYREAPAAKPVQAPVYAPTKVAEELPPRPQAKSSNNRPKQFDNVQMSLSSIRMADPRGLRVQRLLESNVLELSMEKSTILNVLPSTQYDLYMRHLRLPNASMRQMGVPVEQEKRDMECNTDTIETANKSVQFSYGDDTAFYRLLEDVRRKKGLRSGNATGGRGGGAEGKDDDGDGSGGGRFNAQPTDPSSTIGATRLTTFLQRASRLCEHVLDTRGEGKESDEIKADASSRSVFDSKGWQPAGTDKTNGGNELVRTRKINSVRFSALQPHLVVTAHPYPVDEGAELDLKPYKGLYCVWDAGNAGGPQYVLESAGQPTTCCFSATQAHFLLAGTMEGSLHLWDLREDSSLHKDKDAVDLRISRGIRKPSYSTSLPFLSMSSTTTDLGDDDATHSAPIVAVESLNPFPQHPFRGGAQGSQAVVSQFVSVDEAGLVMFWVTADKGLGFGDAGGVNGVQEDVQRAPWGGVALVLTRQIHTHNHTLYRSPSAGKQNKSGGAVLQGPLAVGCIPHDLSTLLISGNSGDVHKVSRYGDGAAPTAYHRIPTSTSEVRIVDPALSARSTSINDAKPKASEVKHYVAVSCIAARAAPVTPMQSTTAAAAGADDGESKHDGALSAVARAAALARVPLVLVGRQDGTVDLFHMEDAAPVQTWDLASFVGHSSNGGGKSKNGKGDHKRDGSAKVVMLQWCTTRPGVFFACDAAGNVFHFDLLVSLFAPVCVEAVGVAEKVSGRTFALSLPRPATGGFWAGTVTAGNKRAGEGDQLQLRRGNAGVTKSSADRYDTQERALYEALFHFTAPRAPAPVVMMVPPGTGAEGEAGLHK